ncbi:ribonuclease H-like domain-containing protein [Tanacetum coccineum]
MFLSQRKYVVEILERAHMVNCNPSRTLVDTESKLGDDGDPIYDPTLYRNHGLKLVSSSTTSLVAYSDADWAGCPTTRRSNLDLVAADQVRVLHVPSRYQYADIFATGLPSALFEEFRTSLSVWCSPVPTAWEC